MYSRLQLAFKWFQFYIHASNGRGHGIHSPFVFDFVSRILNDKRSFYAYDTVEKLREQLLHDTQLLEILDLGAGSSAGQKKELPVSAIASRSAKSPKWAQLLFRTVQHYQPASMLELGTSLGLSAAYLALGNPAGQLYTLEGSPAIAEKAQRNLDAIGLEAVKLIEGNFDDTLPRVLSQMKQLDLVFIDGNHRKEPTLRYFNACLERAHKGSIFILDDIHWSGGMEEAWKEIKHNGRTRLTIDLFFVGIVFFMDDMLVPQHFRIRF